MPKNTPPMIRRGRPRGSDGAGGALTGDSTVAAELARQVLAREQVRARPLGGY
jgi:hypothetical protein